MALSDEDVKRLLGRAFGPEPPLALDRDEIFRRGQRRVRIRRIAASGGVAASVVAVVVGAAAITGITGGQGGDTTPAYRTGADRPPSTTSAESAPPGPRLPLTPTSAVAGSLTTDLRADELTKVMAGIRLIPAEFTPIPVVEDGRGALAFRRFDGFYRLTADLRDAKGDGSIEVLVSYPGAGSSLSGCTGQRPAQASCDVRHEAGIQIRVSTERGSSGYLAYAVHALRPDGTLVEAASSNLGGRLERDGPPSRPTPPLDVKLLQSIAVLPGLTFF